MKRHRIGKKQMMDRLSVVAAAGRGESGALPAGLSAAAVEGFGLWMRRRERRGLLRRCSAAAAVSLVLCGYAPSTVPAAVKTPMAVNACADRAQAYNSVQQTVADMQ